MTITFATESFAVVDDGATEVEITKKMATVRSFGGSTAELERSALEAYSDLIISESIFILCISVMEIKEGREREREIRHFTS